MLTTASTHHHGKGRDAEMLILSRRPGEEIWIDVQGIRIKLVVTDIRHNRVRLGFTAPMEAVIHRRELLERMERPDAEGRE